MTARLIDVANVFLRAALLYSPDRGMLLAYGIFIGYFVFRIIGTHDEQIIQTSRELRGLRKIFSSAMVFKL